MDYQTQMDRWLERAVDDPDLIAELNAVKDDPGAVSDRFYRELTFGTGGLTGHHRCRNQPHEPLYCSAGHTRAGGLPQHL